ncbi:MAG: DUF1330 domain-containing protein [Parvibaculum sp.]|nr:DUF1330 domain-containing protein [Parvibaculum sp.]|tara:strand:- start:2579 stop:3034 length:456 start_codon:yes stop_codon:yes gene_type:complete
MTNNNQDVRIIRLIEAYGSGDSASGPTPAQWASLAARAADAPVTLINFFKMRDAALYVSGSDATPCSGQEAFSRYAAVSAPGLDKVGGKFTLLAPFAASLIGADEDWDFVAIGSYPDLASVLALFEMPDYQTAFTHRVAACARQKTLICNA